MKLVLVRDLSNSQKDDNDSVRGCLIISDKKNKTITTLKTLENILYLVAEGKYKLIWEYSPKFKTHLWELYGTNPRGEIKFHEGYFAKHSKGCILLGGDSLDSLHNTLSHSDSYEIKIINI